MKNKEMKKMEKLIIKGIVKSAKYGSTQFDDQNKYRLFIEGEDIPYDKITAYESVGSKLTPKWFKEQTGSINLTSIYSIPVMDIDGNRIDFDAWLESGCAIGSEVQVSITQKDGAIYPKAVKVITEGEPYDPFADFN